MYTKLFTVRSPNILISLCLFVFQLPYSRKNSETSGPVDVLRAPPSSSTVSTHLTSIDMIIRLGRLTPGYFRLLQRQVAGEVQTQPQDRAVNQIAMMLAIMGLSLSYYSAKQMTEKVQAQPAP
ncbi:putative transmembrane protein ZNF593OS isoform X1 [Siniperca chuatsi]|uniref:putative transmembrane protein ZNF593OS isoform X1 n=1 Tax=Siniperca chuatsi TaxID=119488 RepID=UPI001CE17199|nr:putative transmembrane protein ZNF593OS isoform X1 [Siniperca chuatsi]